MVYAVSFLIATFLGYNYFLFRLMDTLLKKSKVKKLFRVSIGLANSLIVLLLIFVFDFTPLGDYIVFSVVMFAELIFFYRDKPSRSLFCLLACAIHVMSMRSLSIVGFAAINNCTIYDVIQNPFMLVVTMGVAFLLLDIITFAVIKIIPAKSIRIITQHPEQLIYMTVWLMTVFVYLLINSTVFTSTNDYIAVLTNQIFAPIAIVLGVYIFLFFSFKTNDLLGYKEKTEELQHTVDKERQYRTTIDTAVFRTIEVNFTEGIIISGFEDYEEFLGKSIHDYSKMLSFMIMSVVHHEDREEFIKYLSPKTVVEEYKAGNREIFFDYRRLMPDGSFVWMHVLMAIILDSQSNNVMGYVQIKDIDNDKKRQMELQYKAERDLLTGLYNKCTTEALIAKRLATNKDNGICGMLVVIDIDNFKTINDRLGHLYGDAVLSELSESLRKVFRDCDIVGRIGGDEFLVFVEGVRDEHIMVSKAQSICAAFLQTYANEKNEGYTVSSSVGVAVFPKDGHSFEALFKCADLALYTAKAQGKNRYSFYNQDSHMSYFPSRTEIDTNGIVQKSFKDNRVEYVFRMLYGSDDTTFAVESVLELIAKNFGFSRANIFELNEASTLFNAVFEWCATGVSSVTARFIDVPLINFDFVIETLDNTGGMFLAVPTDFPEHAQKIYTSIGIKSIVHFSIKERDKLIGVIAFQNCADENIYMADPEFEELRTICQVLSVFMAKQLNSERELLHHHSVQALMDNMNCISYVIDRESYEVYYENQNTVSITGHKSVGTKCYVSYRGLDAPCEDCPLTRLSIASPKCTLELYTELYKIHTRTSATLLDWANNKAMLISSIAVTEYKCKQ